MPIHDRTRVTPGIFHHFHQNWIVNDPLPERPLFVSPGQYVNVPLEATYREAWRSVPPRWRGVPEDQPPRAPE